MHQQELRPVKILPFHGPLRQYGRVSFQMNTSGIARRSTLKEKLPIDGSEGLFHDVSFTFSPVFLLLVSFMFGNTAFDGCWKLSHMILPVVPSNSTRFPESSSLAVELVAKFCTLEVQMISFCPFNTTISLPSSDIVTTPEESLRGLLKKPKVNLPFLELRVSGSLMNVDDVMVPIATVTCKV